MASSLHALLDRIHLADTVQDLVFPSYILKPGPDIHRSKLATVNIQCLSFEPINSPSPSVSTQSTSKVKQQSARPSATDRATALTIPSPNLERGRPATRRVTSRKSRVHVRGTRRVVCRKPMSLSASNLRRFMPMRMMLERTGCKASGRGGDSERTGKQHDDAGEVI